MTNHALPASLTRRAFLGSTALPLMGCAPDRTIVGGFNGASGAYSLSYTIN